MSSMLCPFRCSPGASGGDRTKRSDPMRLCVAYRDRIWRAHLAFRVQEAPRNAVSCVVLDGRHGVDERSGPLETHPGGSVAGPARSTPHSGSSLTPAILLGFQ